MWVNPFASADTQTVAVYNSPRYGEMEPDRIMVSGSGTGVCVALHLGLNPTESADDAGGPDDFPSEMQCDIARGPNSRGFVCATRAEIHGSRQVSNCAGAVSKLLDTTCTKSMCANAMSN
jgi:hypothetical protein